MKSILLILSAGSLLLCHSAIKAQSITKNSFGKGIKILAEDSSFYMKFSTRIQNRFDGTYQKNATNEFTDKVYLRRARLKFDGWAFSPKVKYKMEFNVISGSVLDAVVKWNFAKNTELWVGQTKLPGNRERVISSQKLQFVDRSLLNSRLNIDRDKGLQLRHHFKVGEMVIREAISLSHGEGRNVKDDNIGHDYTGRIEFLPFGNFASKGDYFSSDLKREKTPKLAIGVTYDYNNNAIRSGGQLGSYLNDSRDLSTLFADFMFKYNGLSVMGGYGDKTVANDISPMVFTLEDDQTLSSASFYTGTAINIQAGYLLKSNWEISSRYTSVSPESETGNPELTEYTLGLSKYVVGHSLKVQSDVSLHQEEGVSDDKIIVRIQVEISF